MLFELRLTTFVNFPSHYYLSVDLFLNHSVCFPMLLHFYICVECIVVGELGLFSIDNAGVVLILTAYSFSMKSSRVAHVHALVIMCCEHTKC